MSAFGYVSAQSIEEAVGILASHPEARPLAGGHNLLLQANRDRIRGSLLVDLGKIGVLKGIDRRPDGLIRIGAMTTIDAIASSELIRSAFPALAEAAALVGDAQLRNRATIGGNLAAADPEADLPAVLLALDADIHVNGPQGWRQISAGDFFDGPSHVSLRRDEVIASVMLPVLPEHSGTAYLKFKHPARLYAVCGVAAVVSVANGRIASARLALTGAGDHPCRLDRVETELLNKPATGELTVPANAFEAISFRGDLFASAEYRRHLAHVLTKRALKQALAGASA